jgi:hypothetical protein
MEGKGGKVIGTVMRRRRGKCRHTDGAGTTQYVSPGVREDAAIESGLCYGGIVPVIQGVGREGTSEERDLGSQNTFIAVRGGM